MKMTWFHRLLILIAVTASALVVIYHYKYISLPLTPPEKVGQVKTENMIKQVFTAINLFKLQYGYLPFVVSGNQQKNELLVMVLCDDTNSAVAKNINHEGVILMMQNYLNENSHLKDAWGNQIHILFATNSNGILIGSKTFNSDVVIWSDGKNGINEFGAGDDILFIKN